MSSRHIRRLLGIVVASALVAALGVAGASAHGTGPATRPANAVNLVSVRVPAAQTSASIDGDNVQSGDQTTPDTGVEANVSDSAPATGAVTLTRIRAATAKQETETSGEVSNETASDGPGGHQDPAGQGVQHDFQGEE